MKFAACVGSAGLPHFTELNICLLRHVFGQDIPITIRDDRSVQSSEVEEVASRRDCFYNCADVPLGHFAGDIQATIDALSLADAVGADVAIKMSQRAMVASQSLKPIIIAKFQVNPGALAIIPGRPNPNFIRVGHQQFARFPNLTDIVFMRTRGELTAEFIKKHYEDQVHNGKHYHDAFVEVFWDKIRNGPLAGKVILAEEITNHQGGGQPLYLRRYQNTQESYMLAARTFGISGGPWDLGERASTTRHYDPRPRI